MERKIGIWRLKEVEEICMENVFLNNDLYEYEVESVVDSSTGGINKNSLKNLLTRYASNGWRLKFALTNELGVNRTSIGYGGMSAGTNSTIDETLLIFERKVHTSHEMTEIIRMEEEKEKNERIEKDKQIKELEELKRQNFKPLIDSVNANMSSQALLYIYKMVSDKKKVIYNLMVDIGIPITLAELRTKFDDNIDLMELGSYLGALVNEGKITKDEETKKYSSI